jgi:hypothetical protein
MHDDFKQNRQSIRIDVQCTAEILSHPSIDAESFHAGQDLEEQPMLVQ